MLKQVSDAVARFLGVRPGEGERIALVLIYVAAAVGGIVVTGQVVGRSLFLSALPKSAIPFKYILPPVALVLTMAAYTKAAQRLSVIRLTLISHGVIIVGLIGFRILLESPARDSLPVLLALVVFCEVCGGVVMIEFWTLAGALFNSREARRLFGIIAGGATTSGMVFGALLGSLSTDVASKNLLFIMVASVVVAGAAVTLIWRRCGERLQSDTGSQAPRSPEQVSAGGVATPQPAGVWAEVSQVLASPLLRAMSLIVITIALVSNTADYQLDLALKGTYGDHAGTMVRFLSLFRLYTGIGSVLVQVLFARRLLERFGVFAALALLPTFVGFGSLAILATGGMLWAVVIPRGSDAVLKFGVHDSAFNLLYLPISGRLRSKAKAVVDGIIKPPIVGLLGLAFLAVDRLHGVSLVYWSPLVLVLVLGWFELLRRASRHYVTALSESIAMRRIDLEEENLDLMDEGSIRILTDAMQSPDSGKVLHALALLSSAPRLSSTDGVVGLLEHPSAEVREQALMYLGDAQAVDQVGPIRRLFEDSHDDVRAAAIASFGRLAGRSGLADLSPQLAATTPRVRASAVVAMIRYSGLDGILRAGTALQGLLASHNPAERAEGAWALGELELQAFYEPLLHLMDDESVAVRVAAIEAVGRVRAEELLPKLIEMLADPVTRQPATRALGQCTSVHAQGLMRIVADEAAPAATRAQLVRAFEANAFPDIVRFLLTRLEEPHPMVRAAIYGALVRLRAQGYSLAVEQRTLLACLRRELRIGYQNRVRRQDIHGRGGACELLDESLKEEVAEDLDRVLDLLTLAYPQLPHEDVRLGLKQGDERLRANVLEFLDNALEPRSKQLVMSYLSGELSEHLGALGITHQSFEQRLRALLDDDQPWLRCCAVAVAGELRQTALRPQIEAALADPDALTRETAEVALAQLDAVTATATATARRPGPGGRSESSRPLHPEGSMSLSTLEKILFLKSVGFLQSVPARELARIAPIATEVRWEAGVDFIREGDTGDCLFVVVDGEVVVTVGGRRVAQRYHSRDVIGELAVLADRKRNATCTALTEVVALRIGRDDFKRLMSERADVAVAVVGILLRYLDQPRPS